MPPKSEEKAVFSLITLRQKHEYLVADLAQDVALLKFDVEAVIGALLSVEYGKWAAKVVSFEVQVPLRCPLEREVDARNVRFVVGLAQYLQLQEQVLAEKIPQL